MQKYNLFYLNPTSLSKILSLQLEKLVVFRGGIHEIHEQESCQPTICDYRDFCFGGSGLLDKTVLTSGA